MPREVLTVTGSLQLPPELDEDTYCSKLAFIKYEMTSSLFPSVLIPAYELLNVEVAMVVDEDQDDDP